MATPETSTLLGGNLSQSCLFDDYDPSKPPPLKDQSNRRSPISDIELLIRSQVFTGVKLGSEEASKAEFKAEPVSPSSQDEKIERLREEELPTSLKEDLEPNPLVDASKSLVGNFTEALLTSLSTPFFLGKIFKLSEEWRGLSLLATVLDEEGHRKALLELITRYLSIPVEKGFSSLIDARYGAFEEWVKQLEGRVSQKDINCLLETGEVYWKTGDKKQETIFFRKTEDLRGRGILTEEDCKFLDLLRNNFFKELPLKASREESAIMLKQIEGFLGSTVTGQVEKIFFRLKHFQDPREIEAYKNSCSEAPNSRETSTALSASVDLTEQTLEEKIDRVAARVWGFRGFIPELLKQHLGLETELPEESIEGMLSRVEAGIRELMRRDIGALLRRDQDCRYAPGNENKDLISTVLLDVLIVVNQHINAFKKAKPQFGKKSMVDRNKIIKITLKTEGILHNTFSGTRGLKENDQKNFIKNNVLPLVKGLIFPQGLLMGILEPFFPEITVGLDSRASGVEAAQESFQGGVYSLLVPGLVKGLETIEDVQERNSLIANFLDPRSNYYKSVVGLLKKELDACLEFQGGEERVKFLIKKIVEADEASDEADSVKVFRESIEEQLKDPLLVEAIGATHSLLELFSLLEKEVTIEAVYCREINKLLKNFKEGEEKGKKNFINLIEGAKPSEGEDLCFFYQEIIEILEDESFSDSQLREIEENGVDTLLDQVLLNVRNKSYKRSLVMVNEAYAHYIAPHLSNSLVDLDTAVRSIFEELHHMGQYPAIVDNILCTIVDKLRAETVDESRQTEASINHLLKFSLKGEASEKKSLKGEASEKKSLHPSVLSCIGEMMKNVCQLGTSSASWASVGAHVVSLATSSGDINAFIADPVVQAVLKGKPTTIQGIIGRVLSIADEALSHPEILVAELNKKLSVEKTHPQQEVVMDGSGTTKFADDKGKQAV